MTFCTDCGKQINDDVKFCSGCGKAIAEISNEPADPTCSNCGKKLEEGAKFCSGCGSVITQKVIPIESLSTADSDEITQQITKFESARTNLLVVIGFTVVNLILLVFNADISFLFSASLPQFIYIFTESFILALFSIIPYLAFWFFAKRVRALIVAALIYFSIDVIILIYFISLIGFDFSLVIDIAFSVWILFYLVRGVISWNNLRNVNSETYSILLQEKKSNKTA